MHRNKVITMRIYYNKILVEKYVIFILVQSSKSTNINSRYSIWLLFSITFYIRFCFSWMYCILFITSLYFSYWWLSSIQWYSIWYCDDNWWLYIETLDTNVKYIQFLIMYYQTDDVLDIPLAFIWINIQYILYFLYQYWLLIIWFFSIWFN